MLRHSRVHFLGNVILATGSLAFALLLAEGLCRVFIPDWTPRESERVNFWVFDPRLGWAHRPGQSGEMVHQDFTIHVSINHEGYRDDEYPFNRTDKKRLLVLGDSFAWGFGVEQSERFSELLEKQFPQWEIINLGVSGYSTDQELLVLQTELYRYHPDKVLVLLHRNDFWGNAVEEAYSYYKPRFELTKDNRLELRNVPVPEMSTHQKLKRWLLGKTWFLGRAYATVTNVITRLAFRLGSLAALLTPLSTDPLPVNPSSTPDGTETEPDDGGDYSLRVTCALLVEMNRLAGTESVTMQLAGFSLDASQSAALSACSAEAGLPFLDMSPTFRARGKEVRFEHDFHWNVAGHQQAAELLAPFLFQANLR